MVTTSIFNLLPATDTVVNVNVILKGVCVPNMKILDAYIDMNEYTHMLVVKYPDETGEGTYRSYIHIHSTGVKPPPIDPLSLKGRQITWILKKVAGDFPRE